MANIRKEKHFSVFLDEKCNVKIMVFRWNIGSALRSGLGRHWQYVTNIDLCGITILGGELNPFPGQDSLERQHSQKRTFNAVQIAGKRTFNALNSKPNLFEKLYA